MSEDTWSHSRLRSFTTCPAQYACQYVAGLTPRFVSRFADGSRLHAAIEEYSRHCYAQRCAVDSEAMDEIAARYEDDGLADGLQQFVDTHRFDWSRAVADGDSVERYFEKPLPGDYGILRGYIDFVEWNEAERSLIIWDRKSHYMPPDPQEICPRQLQVYAWAMGQEFPAAEKAVCIFDFWRSAGGQVLQEWELPLPTSIDWALRLIDRAKAEKRFEASPGDHCQFCGFVDRCPALAGCHDGRYYADAIPVLEEYVKRAKASVKATVQVDGPLFTSDGAWDFYTPKEKGRRYTFPRGKAGTKAKQAFAERVEASGLPWPRYVQSYDHEALAELVPVEGDPFAEEAKDGAQVDFSDILVPMPAQKTFGYRRFAEEEAEPEGGPAAEAARTA